MNVECKHFNGVQLGVCGAKVRYADVRSDAPGFWLPCLNPALLCAAREYFTPDEIAENDRLDAEAVARVICARNAIVARHGKARGLRDALPCPVCSVGTLNYIIAGNGHIHGQCTTANCVQWLE